MTKTKDTIARDRAGEPLRIGTLVRICDGAVAGARGKVGAVRQVTYKADGSCMVNISGLRNATNARYVEAVELGALEQAVYETLTGAGARVKVEDIEAVSERLRAAFETEG